MSFGNQTSERSPPADNRSEVTQPRKKFPWLRGGVLCMALGLVNIIYFSQTGKILLGPRSRGAATPAFDLTMSILVFVFGIVCLAIHFYRSRE
jgi:hypothetical protein